MRLPIASLGLAWLFLVTGCGDTGQTNSSTNPKPPGTPGSQDPDRITQIYAKNTPELHFEIDYQTGAAPFTSGTAADSFRITRGNVESLFKGDGKIPAKTVVLPNQLNQMEELKDIADTTFTGQRILEIAAQHRSLSDVVGQRASFYILFLNGLYNDGKAVRNDVLGVALGQTGVVAMFKPVITSSSAFQQVQKYVEQSTLVHEFGHSIGLVNFGIPLTAQHQDTANGAHCSNTKCVMYYANEGASAAVQFAQKYILTGDEVLFDTDCLNDTKARLVSAQ